MNIIGSMILFYFLYMLEKLKKEKYLNIISGIILITIVVLGIIGTYCLPLRLDPYDPLVEGEYGASVIWGLYHYGAFSFLSHKFYQCIYSFATICSSLPTIVLFVVFVFGFCMVKYRKKIAIGYSLVLLACIVTVILFSCMNQPADSRYFGVVILCLVISVWTCMHNMFFIVERKHNVLFWGIMLLVWNYELLVYQPNIKMFSPMWVAHSRSFNENVRLGQWYAGEAMSWGEELAIAGRKINNIVDENEIEKESVSIYSNYGLKWLNNPGYAIYSTNEIDNNTKFDNTSFFIFTKKNLFRMTELPPFINEVKPIDTIKYKGEIAVWIYTGEQLKVYNKYFENSE